MLFRRRRADRKTAASVPATFTQPSNDPETGGWSDGDWLPWFSTALPSAFRLLVDDVSFKHPAITPVLFFRLSGSQLLFPTFPLTFSLFLARWEASLRCLGAKVPRSRSTLAFC